MKKLYIWLLLLGATGMAQLKGNGEIVEQSFSIETIHTIEINLTADFVLDAQSDNEIIIVTDRNLMGFISKDIENGYLNISQVKWIQPTKRPTIHIGIASLKKLINNAHSTTQLLSVDRDTLEIVANVGKLKLYGKVKHLDLTVGTASVSAEELLIQNANVSITGFGSAHLNVVEMATTDIAPNGNLRFVKEPGSITGNYKSVEKVVTDTSVRFINVQLKNNSWGRNKYVVVGPKADGSTFSYGFELWPLQSKEERWTIGSELFEVNKLGQRVSLLKLTAEDADGTVKLY